MLVFFYRGSLPWQGLRPVGKKCELIKEKKMTLPVETLCEGRPAEFVTYIRYTRSLGLLRCPDYSYVRRRFRRLFDSLGFKNDNVFYWTEKLFHEAKSGATSAASTHESS